LQGLDGLAVVLSVTLSRVTPALRHNILHLCVRELGTRSETYRGSDLTGVSEAQTLVR
jgi:hypothetical protein